MTASENVYSFKAETNKVLKIITHSLYQKKEVFLREIISNASDALNKVRIKKITSENILDPDLELDVEIIADQEANTLTIRDTGIGMSKKELITNLGTVAQSGTEEFLNALDSGGDTSELIGMFGVGFYSAFLVADKVEVSTRSASPNSKSWNWNSIGEDSFEVVEGNKKTRGTDIILHLKEDHKEFLEDFRLKNLIKQYSNYVTFPVRLGDEIINEQVALWRKSPSEVEQEDYENFFQHLGHGGSPMATIHISVEVPIQFFAILYIPTTKSRFWGQDVEWGLTLYNKKVLINENNKDLLPEHLRFVVGVVDGENLELNVSRDVLQESQTTRTIKKYIHKKIIEELEKMTEDDENDKYMTFWREFGPFLKEGIAQSAKHKDRLIELLRFHSTGENGNLGSISMADYVTRMKPDQEKIYYLTGLELDLLKKSPHLEYYKENELEVFLMGEAIDSFMMMNSIFEYHEKKFFLIDQDEEDEKEEPEGKEEIDEDDDDTKKEKNGPFAPLLTKAVEVLENKVSDVKISGRLVGSVARLVTPKGGINSNLQRAMRIMEAQSGGAGLNMPMMGKVLEINPNHDLIKNLNQLVENEQEDERIILLIHQIHDNARILEGDVPDFGEMLSRLEKIMGHSINSQK